MSKPSAVVQFQESAAGLPVPMDMTDILKFQAQLEDIAVINNMNAALYMRDFLKAKELATSYTAKLMFQYEQARNETKRQYALAYLERSQAYIKEKGLKDTDETKKQYVQIDASYQKAKDAEDMFAALLELLSQKISTFERAHDDARKILESTRDPRGSAAALPSGRDT
jgi:hypothetical protein